MDRQTGAERGGLPAELPSDPDAIDPWHLFSSWLAQAEAAGEPEPRAMALATVGASSRPSMRMVLLREHSPRGLVFCTSYESRKSRALATHAVASALFWWPGLMRQVRAVGPTVRVPRPRSEELFRRDSRAAQIEAWASRQSEPIGRRADLLEAVRETELRFSGSDVPYPPHWGGYTIDVDTFEFWQGGHPGNLNDRIVLVRREEGWRGERLQP